jgi:hypothetical protein
MPFPIGHTAIGLAAYETVNANESHGPRWARILFVTVLANLPDLDIMVGLLLIWCCSRASVTEAL